MPETTEQVAVLAAVALVAVDQPAAAVEEVAAEDLEVRKAGHASTGVDLGSCTSLLITFYKIVLLLHVQRVLCVVL